MPPGNECVPLLVLHEVTSGMFRHLLGFLFCSFGRISYVKFQRSIFGPINASPRGPGFDFLLILGAVQLPMYFRDTYICQQ